MRRRRGWLSVCGRHRTRARRADLRSDRGSGSVLVLAIVGSVLALTAGLLPLLSVFVQTQVAANAADAAALGAADALTGAVPGTPCALAEQVARRNGARLVSCGGDGLEASVSVAVGSFGFAITARARAGPSPGRERRRRSDTPCGRTGPLAHPGSPSGFARPPPDEREMKVRGVTGFLSSGTQATVAGSSPRRPARPGSSSISTISRTPPPATVTRSAAVSMRSPS
ncbi:Rv3654c family TadE-like protein [Agromyces silvae]|uniref:Rv3654c family TadE-like protein n=1 Tax=Agromyces silvae TaxID=3388266 RepID=UPI0035A1A10C